MFRGDRPQVGGEGLELQQGVGRGFEIRSLRYRAEEVALRVSRTAIAEPVRRQAEPSPELDAVHRDRAPRTRVRTIPARALQVSRNAAIPIARTTPITTTAAPAACGSPNDSRPNTRLNTHVTGYPRIRTAVATDKSTTFSPAYHVTTKPRRSIVLRATHCRLSPRSANRASVCPEIPM